MFFVLLIILLVAAAAHVALSKPRTFTRGARLFLLYLLVGYCGVPMVLVSLWCLARPGEAASVLGFPPGGPFQQFFAVAYLGMSIISLLAPFLRRSYVIGPAVCWAVFFAGATVIHFRDASAHGDLSHGNMWLIFATHGLISLLLIGLIASGASREKTSPTTT
jgi:hypothetical protein